MASKPRIYQAHTMEGKQIPEESGRRCLEFQKLLGDGYTYLLPEDWQASVKHDDIEAVDYIKWRSADIIVADLYDIGLDRRDNSEREILGIGTNQEIGWTKAWNREVKSKKKVLIVIIRQSINKHPFFKCKDLYTVTSLEDAVLFVKDKRWLKK